MSDQQLAERAIAAVRTEVDDIKEVREGPIVHDFLGGDLVVVYVTYETEDEEDDDGADEFYVHFVGTTTNVYTFPIDLYRVVATYRPSVWQQILRSGSITGLVAVLITFTICYLALQGQSEKIPQVLGAALTTILGFYFGSRVTQR